MPKFKIDADAKGNFYKEDKFKLVPGDLVSVDSGGAKVFIKLLGPKDAHIKTLTLTINKKTMNVTIATGNRVLVGPFPMLEGDNKISFEAHSDQADATHEFEVAPQLLK